MTDHTIYGLSNEDYHNSEPYRQYLSSSQLKKYLISPKAFKHSLDNPEETKSDALRFGSLFHDCMGALAEGGSLEHIIDTIAVFEPPINAKTGQPYGTTTKAYKEAYEAFTTSLNGTLVSTAEERDMANAMLQSLLFGSGSTSEQVRKLLRWGKPEVSHFVEYEGCKFKFRPDLTTRYRRKRQQCVDLYDWKTVATDDLSEESINRIILRYGYHISASHYQFFYHELFGIWPGFILVLVSKVAPYDCVMVDISNYGYRYLPDVDMVIPGPGAMEFKRLLDLHIKCTKENHWPGAEIRPRSGYSSKGFAGNFDVSEYRFDADAIAGIVDADFRNGIGVILKSCETRPFVILKGQRVAQMLIIKAETVDFEESDSLSETERQGGFGHTGI